MVYHNNDQTLTGPNKIHIDNGAYGTINSNCDESKNECNNSLSNLSSTSLINVKGIAPNEGSTGGSYLDLLAKAVNDSSFATKRLKKIDNKYLKATGKRKLKAGKDFIKALNKEFKSKKSKIKNDPHITQIIRSYIQASNPQEEINNTSHPSKIENNDIINNKPINNEESKTNDSSTINKISKNSNEPLEAQEEVNNTNHLSKIENEGIPKPIAMYDRGVFHIYYVNQDPENFKYDSNPKASRINSAYKLIDFFGGCPYSISPHPFLTAGAEGILKEKQKEQMLMGPKGRPQDFDPKVQMQGGKLGTPNYEVGPYKNGNCTGSVREALEFSKQNSKVFTTDFNKVKTPSNPNSELDEEKINNKSAYVTDDMMDEKLKKISPNSKSAEYFFSGYDTVRTLFNNKMSYYQKKSREREAIKDKEAKEIKAEVSKILRDENSLEVLNNYTKYLKQNLYFNLYSNALKEDYPDSNLHTKMQEALSKDNNKRSLELSKMNTEDFTNAFKEDDLKDKLFSEIEEPNQKNYIPLKDFIEQIKKDKLLEKITSEFSNHFNESIYKAQESFIQEAKKQFEVDPDDDPFEFEVSYSINSYEKLCSSLIGNKRSSTMDQGNKKSFFDARKPLILNFANPRFPGGFFLKGYIAQEESLCHKSTLYPILCQKAFDNQDKPIEGATPAAKAIHHFFQDNWKAYDNRSSNPDFTDTDDLIYSPNVLFLRGNDLYSEDYDMASVITAALPVLGSPDQTEVSENDIPERRIRKVIKTAIYNGNKDIILGAWGCGAFHHSPEKIASLFHKVLVEEGWDKYFDKITFSIIDEKLEIFNKRFNDVQK